jgi:pilus assembly protein CpaE
LVSAEPKSREELEHAARGLGGVTLVLHHVTDFLRAVESARSRQPQFIFLELTDDLPRVHRTSRELRAVAPESTLIGIYRPDSFATEVWEQAAHGAVFVECVREGLRDFLRRPVSANDLRQLLERNLVPHAGGPARLGKVVSFLSNKGGVGKSTLATNTACALARRGANGVLLVDCSLQMGVCATLLDLIPRTTIVDALHERDRLDETLVRELATPHASGVDLLAAPPDAVSAAGVDDELLSQVITMARRTYEYVVVDTFPLFDRLVISILDLSDRAYVVLENVVPTILSAAKLLQLLDQMQFPADRMRLIVNRFSTIAGNPSIADVADQLGRPVDHVLPLDSRVVTAANVGRPFALHPNWWSRLSYSHEQLVTDLIKSLQSQSIRGPGSQAADVVGSAT